MACLGLWLFDMMLMSADRSRAAQPYGRASRSLADPLKIAGPQTLLHMAPSLDCLFIFYVYIYILISGVCFVYIIARLLHRLVLSFVHHFYPALMCRHFCIWIRASISCVCIYIYIPRADSFCCRAGLYYWPSMWMQIPFVSVRVLVHRTYSAVGSFLA